MAAVSWRDDALEFLLIGSAGAGSNGPLRLQAWCFAVRRRAMRRSLSVAGSGKHISVGRLACWLAWARFSLQMKCLSNTRAPGSLSLLGDGIKRPLLRSGRTV